jgi:hypothetical protein
LGTARRPLLSGEGASSGGPKPAPEQRTGEPLTEEHKRRPVSPGGPSLPSGPGRVCTSQHNSTDLEHLPIPLEGAVDGRLSCRSSESFAERPRPDLRRAWGRWRNRHVRRARASAVHTPDPRRAVRPSAALAGAKAYGRSSPRHVGRAAGLGDGAPADRAASRGTSPRADPAAGLVD